MSEMSFALTICLLLYCVNLSTQQLSDCQSMPTSCGKNGMCKPDGICGCNRGFRGATCSLGPPALPNGYRVPGQVDEARPEAFFSIPSGEFVAGTLIALSVVKNSGTAPKMNVFMANGVMPTAQANQAAVLGIDGGDIVVESTELAPNAPSDSDGTFYIVLQAADAPTVTVAFSLEHTAGSLVPGLPDWAFALIIVFAVLCCSILLAIVVFCVIKARNNRHSKPPKKDQNAGIMMQNNSQMWATPMTSDYPSAQNQQQQQMMMMQQQQQPQQQFNMQQSYGERSGSSYPSVMGLHTNTTQSQHSGSYEDQFSRTSQQPLVNQQQYHDDGMLPMW